MLQGTFSQALLETTIIQLTNEARNTLGLPACYLNVRLRTAARRHSAEMAAKHYFSHTSPAKENRDLSDRVEKAGVVMENIVMGENIGVDYFLKIADVPFYRRKIMGKTVYINAENGSTIKNYTYSEFSRHMVNEWMNSPGHRKNILNREFKWIGIGAVAGTYQGFPAVYITQVFMGPVE